MAASSLPSGSADLLYTTPSAYSTGSEVKVSPKVSMYAGELDAEGIIDEEYQAKTKD